jgi:hypothetical protein
MDKLKLILAWFSLVFLFSCKNNDKEALLPEVKGSANDVIVVMAENYWKSGPGKLIRKRFSENFPALPQEEPIFDLLHTTNTNFDNAYKRQRNILIAQIGPGNKKEIIIQKNIYAKPQILISVLSPDQETFESYFQTFQDKIVDLIQDQERERLISSFHGSLENSVRKKLLNEHQVILSIPVGYEISMDSSNFVWLSNEYKNIHEEILVYDYPYKDTSDFSKKSLIAKRNEILKRNVGGTAQGSYMTTEPIYPVKYTEFSMHGKKYTVELRGLWTMIGMAMGGPFVSISQYDEERQRIVTAEGFIFAPGEDKRNFVRRIEAIIYSLEFPTNK